MTIRCFAISLLVLANAVFTAQAQPADKGFDLIVNGNPLAIDAGETVKLKMPDGSELTIKLERNPQVTFRGDGFSFRHSSNYQVATSAPADDINQHLIVTGTGTLVLVQAYRNMDPTTLAEFMLNQISQDDVQAGGKLESRPHQRMIANGLKLSGLKGTVTSSDESAEVEIMSAKTGFGGIIAVSRIDHDNEAADRSFVDMFWSTLHLE